MCTEVTFIFCLWGFHVMSVEYCQNLKSMGPLGEKEFQAVSNSQMKFCVLLTGFPWGRTDLRPLLHLLPPQEE